MSKAISINDIRVDQNIFTVNDAKEAAKAIFAVQASDFENLKNAKWYHRLLNAVSFGSGDKKKIITDIRSLSKLQSLFMFIYQEQYRDVDDTLNEIIESLCKTNEAIKKLYYTCVAKVQPQESIADMDEYEKYILNLFLAQYHTEQGKEDDFRAYRQAVGKMIGSLSLPEGEFEPEQLSKAGSVEVYYRCALELSAIDGNIGAFPPNISDALKHLNISQAKIEELNRILLRELDAFGQSYLLSKYTLNGDDLDLSDIETESAFTSDYLPNGSERSNDTETSDPTTETASDAAGENIHEANVDFFGLTRTQLKILFSIESSLVEADISANAKGASLKRDWLNQWHNAINSSMDGEDAAPYRDVSTLLTAIRTELPKHSNKTWFYLIVLEASVFEAYTPLGLSADDDKHYSSLKFSDQGENIKSMLEQLDVIDPTYVDRFRKTYRKTLDMLSGKWQKVAIGALSVVALSAIAAATAGVAAGPIAVALFGSNFAGLSGAALTSACLAMAGGGAIAAGGAGMAGGVAAIVGGGALLGAVGGGTAVTTASVMAKSSPSLTLTQAVKLEVVLKEVLLNTQQDFASAQMVIDSLNAQIQAQQNELDHEEAQPKPDKKAIANIRRSIQYLKSAYKDMLKFKSSYEIGYQAGLEANGANA